MFVHSFVRPPVRSLVRSFVHVSKSNRFTLPVWPARFGNGAGFAYFSIHFLFIIISFSFILSLHPPIFGIPSCTFVSILGVTFQNDCKFNTHVKNKLVKANKCLHVLRSLRNEGYKQAEIDFLFDTLVLPNFTYALSVYGASESDLTPVQCFFRSLLEKEFYYKEL